MYDITLYRLLVYRTVVEEQSFRRAGHRLGITQPAVSAHVKALENLVGLKLLERSSGRTVTPTQAGGILYTYALETTLNTADLETTLSQLRAGQGGTLVMASSSTLGKHVLPEILAGFKATHPNATIILRTGSKNTVVRQVKSGEVEFGLVLTVGESEGLVSEHLGNEELLLVVGRDHPLAGRGSVSVEELAGYDFTTGVVSSGYQQTIRRQLEAIGLRIRSLPIQLEDADAIKGVVKQGLGVAPLLRCTVAADLRDGSLVELRLDRGPIWIEIRLLARPRKHVFAPVTQKFLDHLRRALKARAGATTGRAFQAGP